VGHLRRRTKQKGGNGVKKFFYDIFKALTNPWVLWPLAILAVVFLLFATGSKIASFFSWLNPNNWFKSTGGNASPPPVTDTSNLNWWQKIVNATKLAVGGLAQASAPAQQPTVTTTTPNQAAATVVDLNTPISPETYFMLTGNTSFLQN
jgi:hypothetical protein